MSLTSGSNNSFTRMRLIMMMKSRSGSFINGVRIAMTLFMVTVFFLLLSFKESGKQPSDSGICQKPGTDMAQNIVRGSSNDKGWNAIVWSNSYSCRNK